MPAKEVSSWFPKADVASAIATLLCSLLNETRPPLMCWGFRDMSVIRFFSKLPPVLSTCLLRRTVYELAAHHKPCFFFFRNVCVLRLDLFER